MWRANNDSKKEREVASFRARKNPLVANKVVHLTHEKWYSVAVLVVDVCVVCFRVRYWHAVEA